jgi:CRP-like cAMP-binding protein
MKDGRLWRARRALEASPIFGALEPAQLDALVAYGVTVRHRARETIFAKGDPGESLMVVLGGKVMISNCTPGGKEAILGYLGPGDVLGEVALLDGKPRSADAVAIEPCELFVLRRRELSPLLAAHPALTIRLVEVLCRKLRRATSIIEELMCLSGAPRIANALLRLAEEHGRRQGESLSIGIRIRQTALGDQVGLSREVVNRQLRCWGRAGIVAVDGGHITILQPQRLRDVAVL